MGIIKQMPNVNKKAFVVIVLFGVSLLIARIVININSGKWPGFVLHLRCFAGFVFAAPIALGIYPFMGIDILLNR